MNDLIYNEIVATPGYELEFAVGTTYSLDAEAFLAIALSFARLGDVSDADFQSPFRLLEGLRQANGRVAVFCNRGGLKPPTRMNPLYAMLDKSVFEISDDRKGKELANFHPKIWVIKERSLDNRSKSQIKLIVMSSNLTKDTSLDIAVSMIAPFGVKPKNELLEKHKPLKDYLLILAENANSDKRKRIRELVRDLDSMGPFELDSHYEDYDLVPIHFGENLNALIEIDSELPAEKMAVVSPFVDADTLKWINGYHATKEKLLITRMDSLTPEIMDIYSGDNREVWVMSQIAEQNDVQPMNLHAKMFFSWGPKPGGVYLWLGSANATRNGFSRNSEFLIRLKLKRGQNQFENFKAEFCDEKKQLCERINYLPEIEIQKGNNDLAISVRKNLIKKNNLTSEVVNVENDCFVIINAIRAKDIPGKITFAPIQEPWNEVALTPETMQCRIKIGTRSHLSELYILKVEPFDNEMELVRMVIKIPTKGIPEDRDDQIFRSLIDTRDKFLNYVEMMITDRPHELASLMLSQIERGTFTSTTEQNHHSNAIYESLLRIVATNPERLKDVQDIVSRLEGNVVPTSFKQMCEVFNQSIKRIR